MATSGSQGVQSIGKGEYRLSSSSRSALTGRFSKTSSSGSKGTSSSSASSSGNAKPGTSNK